MSKTIDDHDSMADINPNRSQIEDLYTDYNIALDDLNLEAWPQFFTQTCLYRITTRENWEGKFPLSTIICESREMLEDRVAATRKSMMYAPRSYRRYHSGLKIISSSAGVTKTRLNFFVAQTLVDKPSEVAFCGVAYDTIVEEESTLRFKERICVMDTEMIPNSLIYPI